MSTPLDQQSLREVFKRISEMDKPKVREKSQLEKFNKWILIIFSLMIFGILVFYFFTWYHPEDEGPDYVNNYNLGDWHNWGDAFGGLSAPFIGLLSSLLVYLSFQQQIKANRLVTDVRKEDNILDNLKDYLERIENKYEAINKALQPKKIDMESFLKAAISDLDNLNSKFIHINVLGDDHQKLAKTMEAKMNHDYRDLLSRDTFIKKIGILIRFCNFYADYLFKCSRDSDLTPETKEAVELYTYEYLGFIESRFAEQVIAFSKIDVEAIENGEPKVRIKSLIEESKLFEYGQYELDLQLKEKGTVNSLQERQELKRMKSSFKVIQDAIIRGDYPLHLTSEDIMGWGKKDKSKDSDDNDNESK